MINFEQRLPSEGDVVLVFEGTGNPLQVPAERSNHYTVTAIIPGTVMVLLWYWYLQCCC